MNVDWYRCKGSVWCELNKINADHPYLNELEGVYIIWSGTDTKNVLKVGQGFIKNELKTNKNDIAVMAFQFFGLFVTWAEVPKAKRKNVMAYLSKQLKPRMSPAVLGDSPVEVNLPW